MMEFIQTGKGYAVMAPLIEQAIAAAMKQQA